LGENHLPKGNLADNKNNFNKPDDFVKVYRTLYEKKIFNLSLHRLPSLLTKARRCGCINLIMIAEFFMSISKIKQNMPR
jgi:hypothetical protein